MKSVIVICATLAVVGLGAALAQEFMPPMLGGAMGCAPIDTATTLLDLNNDQMGQARALSDKFNKDLEAEMKKTRSALDDKYLGEIKNVLTDDQKKQLDALMAADKKYKDAMTKADDDYRAKISETIYADSKDPAVKDMSARMLRFLPRDQNQLLDRYTEADKALGEKYRDLKTENAKAKAEIYKPKQIDWKDTKAVQAWREEREKLSKDADQKMMDQGLTLLDEPQRKAFDQLVEAQKKWAEATKNADAAYAKDVEAVVGPDKARRLDMHRATMMRRRF